MAKVLRHRQGQESHQWLDVGIDGATTAGLGSGGETRQWRGIRHERIAFAALRTPQHANDQTARGPSVLGFALYHINFLPGTSVIKTDGEATPTVAWATANERLFCELALPIES